MANSYHKSKLSTYKQSPSSNLVSYTSMDYKSLPSSNSNSHMDHSKMSRYSNDISMHSYMDQSTHSSKSSNNTTMHSHMNYSNNSPNRSNNISMHSHMSYYSPNSINMSNNTPLQHSHIWTSYILPTILQICPITYQCIVKWKLTLQVLMNHIIFIQFCQKSN